MIHRVEEIRNANVYGIRPRRTFKEAATKYLNEKTKVSLNKDGWSINRIVPLIGDLFLENIHMGTLNEYIEFGKQQGWKNRTINMPLEVVRHILNLAAGEWIDENGLTWLPSAPKIRLLPRDDAAAPYPLSWQEQQKLFSKLPKYLRSMCIFAVNTGLRNKEVCGLKWSDEIEVSDLDTSVFWISAKRIKNKQDRLVVLNSAARQVIEEMRGIDPVWVFTFRGKPLGSMYTTSFKRAREEAELPFLRIHDLKHTYGRRLRSAGVSYEDRQDLLGHKSKRITTHYSAPELINLIEASERVCTTDWCKSGAMVILKRKNPLRLVAN